MRTTVSDSPIDTVGTYLSREEARAIGEKLLEFANQKEQLYYIKLLDNEEGFYNKNIYSDESFVGCTYEDGEIKTKFTQTEINSDPELKKFEAFAIPVEQEDAA